MNEHHEDVDPEEPEPWDWVTTDHARFCEYGGRECFHVHRDASVKQMWKAIHARMEKDQFWPNVWFISDHGNAHLMVEPRVAQKGRR